MIDDLRLQHFRSYEDTLFEFDAGVNIIVGPNASGKTNLLEAILVLCRGSSYRAGDHELVRYGAVWMRLDGHTDQEPRSIVWRPDSGRLRAEYHVGGTKLSRLPRQRRVSTVVFEPQHMQLLTESPELRRHFVDDMIEQIKPGYESLRRQYKRALSQRNYLLKQAKPTDQLFVWNLRLSDLGGQIAAIRQAFIAEHQNELSGSYVRLAGKKHKVSLVYQSKISGDDYTSRMLKALEDNITFDQERGFTSVGPHRDDIIPYLNGHALMSSASRGETRTMLLALKLLEVHTLEKALGNKPVLLLDDVFSELDGARRRALTEQLRDHQTFITTTDADIVVQHFIDNCRIIPMNS